MEYTIKHIYEEKLQKLVQRISIEKNQIVLRLNNNKEYELYIKENKYNILLKNEKNRRQNIIDSNINHIEGLRQIIRDLETEEKELKEKIKNGNYNISICIKNIKYYKDKIIELE